MRIRVDSCCKSNTNAYMRAIGLIREPLILEFAGRNVNEEMKREIVKYMYIHVYNTGKREAILQIDVVLRILLIISRRDGGTVTMLKHRMFTLPV